MSLRFPIGTSDFLKLRRRGLHYVDKSAFITDVLHSTAEVILLPRPRRFGKTLNLSTLAAFVERTDEDRTDVFQDLAVWQAGADVRAHFGRHPVLFLTFKDVKARTWTDCRAALVEVIAAECRRHEPIVAPVLNAGEQQIWDALYGRQADNATLWRALALLSHWLHRATGERVVLLVDEYDTPIHAGFHHGYYDEVIELFRNLFSGAFKDNSHLEKGVLTGILRVAKESVFSGLNNLAVHTLLSPEMATHFGFTPAEVQALADGCNASERMPDIERWYNGYRFGGQTIYNPWSVLNFLVSMDRLPRPYWVQTASDDILRELLIERGMLAQADLEALVRGEAVTQAIDEHIALRDVHRSSDAVWSFLLFCGYLRVDAKVDDDALGRPVLQLSVPNREVATVYAGLFSLFLSNGLGGPGRVDSLCRALLTGDAQTFGALLGELLLTTLSYHDLGGRRTEAVYQAFVVGLLVTLERTHEVTSNREAGYGRYDVLVSPRQAGQPGAVLELKVVANDDGETVAQALDAALGQVRQREYAAVLRQRGAGPVQEWGAVFDGKRAWVRLG